MDVDPYFGLYVCVFKGSISVIKNNAGTHLKWGLIKRIVPALPTLS